MEKDKIGGFVRYEDYEKLEKEYLPDSYVDKVEKLEKEVKELRKDLRRALFADGDLAWGHDRINEHIDKLLKDKEDKPETDKVLFEWEIPKKDK